MTIIPVENTNQIRGSLFVGVQARNDAEAVTSLQTIAERGGLLLGDVFKWGNPQQPYYYAAVSQP